MIQNKTTAITLAVLTFILMSVLLVIVIFYIFGYSLSSLSENQIYIFFAILVSAVLASMVYGRGSKERANQVKEILEESLGITVNEKDIYKILRTIEQIHPSVVNKYVSLDINVVEEFDDRIEIYKKELSDEELSKIKKIIEPPIEELQVILGKLYLETGMEQFKILAEPEAKPLIELNLQELKKILFD
jgi:ABC-type multidrug transport system fused ATPase/permease subunit